MVTADEVREVEVNKAGQSLCKELRRGPKSTKDLHCLLVKQGFAEDHVSEALWRLTDLGRVRLMLNHSLELVNSNANDYQD